MKLYADLPGRRELQLLGDLGLAVWVVVWIYLAAKTHDAVMALAAPGRKLDEAGTSMASRLRDAGSTVGGIPYVGDDASRPFDGAGSSADQMAAAGRSQVAAVETMAFWITLAVALVPILLALAFYLPPRIRFVRNATAGQRFLDSAADLDLFALRAMAHQPLHVLAGVSDDPAAAWRRQDPDVVRRLAALELKAAGLAPPPGA
ncbi:hypothetical protein G5V58_02010 [Nocardioides anomalus]|uniref:Uncharacterized protein n=1 Tax=Nocardioides anomalus TaxID=2712223 RepID=A0A6G6W9J2_9ACTN|nr:hypothetical protein [Nocardioides anomalus]QIG41710.1 hypothetical protein G5V58_02010 [Nocardioides anomalus]